MTIPFPPFPGPGEEESEFASSSAAGSTAYDDTQANLVDETLEALDTNLGPIAEALGIALDFGAFRYGTAENSLSDLYKTHLDDIQEPDTMWFTNGASWHKVFGYRFSVAILNPAGENNPNAPASIDDALSPRGVSQASAPSSNDPGGASTAVAGPSNQNQLSALTALLPVGLSSALTSVGDLQSFVGLAEEDVTFKHFTLPIPPSQMSTSPIMASSATPTLGGVVEETSKVKFWQISLAGSTGTAVSRRSRERKQRRKMAEVFREVIKSTGLTAGEDAFAALASSRARTLVDIEQQQRINQIANGTEAAVGTAAAVGGAISSGTAAVNAVTNPGADGVNWSDVASTTASAVASAAGAVATATSFADNVNALNQTMSEGLANARLTPPLPYYKSAVKSQTNGFTEAQELQKFFFMYNALKGRHPKKYALLFTNFKTDQTWRCVIDNFSLMQSSDNPFLWKYGITLKCWNAMKSKRLFVGPGTGGVDRFGEGGDLAPVSAIPNSILEDADEILGDSI